ncbi:hypothetical protein D4764_16G0007770 [Takifugu flavidus]|uniref:Uncharacterized protein n=1 Tax=Takifugu flavidus TaxID=433684 RepID=A0A5C6P2B4_9TELE|nr:hypothetical protein D4764_16G0007770 [Takifugu flavidus]
MSLEAAEEELPPLNLPVTAAYARLDLFRDLKNQLPAQVPPRGPASGAPGALIPAEKKGLGVTWYTDEALLHLTRQERRCEEVADEIEEQGDILRYLAAVRCHANLSAAEKTCMHAGCNPIHPTNRSSLSPCTNSTCHRGHPPTPAVKLPDATVVQQQPHHAAGREPSSYSPFIFSSLREDAHGSTQHPSSLSAHAGCS